MWKYDKTDRFPKMFTIDVWCTYKQADFKRFRCSVQINQLQSGMIAGFQFCSEKDMIDKYNLLFSL